jgi:hypothetical protein
MSPTDPLVALLQGDPWVVLALPVVLTFCWCWRERTKRKSRTKLISDYGELMADLAKLEPDQAQRLQGHLERVRPPPISSSRRPSPGPDVPRLFRSRRQASSRGGESPGQGAGRP